MGEPDSTEQDAMMELALSVLDPRGGPLADSLYKTGLHTRVLGQFYAAIKPEIANFVGWRPLKEFDYGRNHADLNRFWLHVLDLNDLSETRAIQIYDGECRRAPAKDYRLYLLRDGRVLYYVGGVYSDDIYARGRKGHIGYGDVVDVCVLLDQEFPPHSSSSPRDTYPFIVLMVALRDALEDAFIDRENKAKAQRVLHGKLGLTIDQVART